MRMVMRSDSREISRMVSAISSSVIESSDDVASSKTSRSGLRSRARAIDSRWRSPPDTLTPPSPITCRGLRAARPAASGRRLFASASRQCIVGCVRVHEQQVLANRAGEQLRLLRHEADAGAKRSDLDVAHGVAVEEKRAGLAARRGRPALDERGLARPRRPDEGDRFAEAHVERDAVERPRRGGRVLKADLVEFDRADPLERDGREPARLLRRGQDRLEIRQRHLGFAIGVDDVPEFLQRTEDEERVDEQREELPHA